MFSVRSNGIVGIFSSSGAVRSTLAMMQKSSCLGSAASRVASNSATVEQVSLFATPDALKVVTRPEITAALRRHAAGDWGDGNKSENDAAMRGEGELPAYAEILSCYRAADGTKFYISTLFTPPQTEVRL